MPQKSDAGGKFKDMGWKILGVLIGAAMIALSTFTYNVTTTLATIQADYRSQSEIVVNHINENRDDFDYLNGRFDDIESALSGSNVSEALMDQTVTINTGNIKINKDNLARHERSKAKDVH